MAYNYGNQAVNSTEFNRSRSPNDIIPQEAKLNLFRS